MLCGKQKHINSLTSACFRPYVYAMHSEQPDTYGHKMGPMNSEVSSACMCTWDMEMYFLSLYAWVPTKCVHVVDVDSFRVFQLNNPLRVIDKIIGQLMNGLKQMKLHRCVNIILVGDHGTDNLTQTHTLVLLFESLFEVAFIQLCRLVACLINSNIKGTMSCPS